VRIENRLRHMRGIRTARAFAPGHVTGFFAPAASTRDPRSRGSVGAGVVLELGAWASASWRAGPTRRVHVTAEGRAPLPISTDVAQRLLGSRRGTLTVRLHHDLPLGQGFGMSAAGATSTALAVADVLGRPRAKAIETAHLCDLFGGGGRGGVAAILGGGLEFRRRPGIPPFGDVERLPWTRSVFVGVVGNPIPSPRLLRDPRFLRRVGEGGSRVDALLAHPDPERFLRASERFTDRMGVASPRLHRVLRLLRTDGAWAFQAMFGESFLAAPRSSTARNRIVDRLRRLQLRAVEVRVAIRGAHRLGPAALPRDRHTQPF